MNRIIIAGSRGINNYSLLEQAIAESNFKIDEVVCGEAKGVDELGRIWATKHEVPIASFPAKWNDLTELPLKIKYNKYGRPYNALSGHNRNKRMAEYATHLILVHFNTPGSLNMLKLAKEYGLTIYEKIVS